MIVHPGGLIGLPVGVPSVVYDVASWRYLLLFLAGCAAASLAREAVHGTTLARPSRDFRPFRRWKMGS